MRKAPTLFGWIALIALGFGAVPAAGEQTPGSIFLQEGGVFCFVQGEQHDPPLVGSWRIVHQLSVTPGPVGAPNPILGVHSLEIGDVALPPEFFHHFTHPLTGTATLADINVVPLGRPVIQVSLVGSSFGVDSSQHGLHGTQSGIWELAYSLQLNRSTLNGRIIGEQRFAALRTGAPTGDPVTYYLNEPLTLEPCP